MRRRAPDIGRPVCAPAFRLETCCRGPETPHDCRISEAPRLREKACSGGWARAAGRGEDNDERLPRDFHAPLGVIAISDVQRCWPTARAVVDADVVGVAARQCH